MQRLVYACILFFFSSFLNVCFMVKASILNLLIIGVGDKACSSVIVEVSDMLCLQRTQNININTKINICSKKEKKKERRKG